MHELGLLGAIKPDPEICPIIVQISSEEEARVLRYIFEGVGFYKPEGYYKQCIEEQHEGRRLLLGAKLDDYLVGYCMLNWKPKYHFFRKFNIPEIQDLNVIPVARRKGVATALISYCENLARSKGHEQMGIGVGLLSDYGPAQRLYARLGYVPDGCGVTYDRETVAHGEIRPFDDELCLMMVKDL
jgi:GNAT superfamily N-acetyltransferase